MKNYGILSSIYEREFRGKIYQWRETVSYKKDAIKRKKYWFDKGYSVAITTQKHGRSNNYDIWTRKQ